jgi:hypothetical protein
LRALIDLVDANTLRDSRRTEFRSSRSSVRPGLHGLAGLIRSLGAFFLL